MSWLVLFVPMVFGFRWAVLKYRATWGARFQRSKFYKAIAGSQLYNYYRLFRPE